MQTKCRFSNKKTMNKWEKSRFGGFLMNRMKVWISFQWLWHAKWISIKKNDMKIPMSLLMSGHFHKIYLKWTWMNRAKSDGKRRFVFLLDEEIRKISMTNSKINQINQLRTTINTIDLIHYNSNTTRMKWKYWTILLMKRMDNNRQYELSIRLNPFKFVKQYTRFPLNWALSIRKNVFG